MLFVLAFLGGVLTILSPCILPVLPFVLTKTGQPFRRSGLPLLVGMATTFAAVATLAAMGGGWAVQVNRYGRFVALSLVLVFGLALLFPRLADRLARPAIALGIRLTSRAAAAGGVRSSLLLGSATGLLWAPCAGPILGLILTGGALRGPSVETSLLLTAYAAGAGVSLAAALLAGDGVLKALRRSLGVERWIRRTLGAAVLVGTLAVALGLDTGFLARLSFVPTTSMERALIATLLPDHSDSGHAAGVPANAGAAMVMARAAISGNAAMSGARSAAVAPAQGASALPIIGALPPLDGATAWINTEPLSADALKGKVVLIDFWTYSCVNCLRALPYVEAWHEKYRDRGLVVIGVHSPEFAFEKDLRNVRREVAALGVNYPVAVDNDYALWGAFSNMYWPAHYLVDAHGDVRYAHFGEGEYEASERAIQALLEEASGTRAAQGVVAPHGEGAALASDEANALSPETYVGGARAERFASAGGLVADRLHEYTVPTRLGLNEWALGGAWTVRAEAAVLESPQGKIVFRFAARDLHLVLGRRPGSGAVKFRVRLDGRAPAADHGTDADAEGRGEVTDERLYQLIRQSGEVRDRAFEIEFSSPGVMVYAFTFG